MAKKGMKRPQVTHPKEKNEVPAVPEIQGKAKHGKEKANPVTDGTSSPSMKTFHGKPHIGKKNIPSEYSVFDNDLAGDNLENDLPFEDLQDL